MQTILYIADLHTAADHAADKDQSKYLKNSQRHMIANAVKEALLQSAGELIRNVQNSKVIDTTLRKSVGRRVRKEQSQINSVLLKSFVGDNTIRSLAKLSDAIFIGNAVSKPHTEGPGGEMSGPSDMFKICIMGRQKMDRTVFYFRKYSEFTEYISISSSGYAEQLHADVQVTLKDSKAALNKLGFSVNMLGCHFAQVTYSLFLAEFESSEANTQAWIASKAPATSACKADYESSLV